MATNSSYSSSFNKTRIDLNKFIKKIEPKLKEIEVEVAEAFVNRARRTLISRATPQDTSSYLQVIEVADNIKVKQNKKGQTYITIQQDREGLSMYLEYGTGLMGKNNPHPNSGNIGWNYAINEGSYINTHTTIDRSGPTKKGFIFENFGNYIDKEDRFVIKESGLKRYTSKKTGIEKFYGPYRYVSKKWIISSGLRPTRYIYDTKLAMKKLISSCKKVSQLRKKLRRF